MLEEGTCLALGWEALSTTDCLETRFLIAGTRDILFTCPSNGTFANVFPHPSVYCVSYTLCKIVYHVQIVAKID